MKMKKTYLQAAGILLPLLAAVISILMAAGGGGQQTMSIPIQNIITGEYSFDSEKFSRLEKDSDLPVDRGDLIVKGHLKEDIPEGFRWYFWQDHIGVSVYINGKLSYIDAPSECKGMGYQPQACMCGKAWYYFLTPAISTKDEVEIHLAHFHKHGNRNAYRDLLDHMYAMADTNTPMEEFIKPYTRPFYIAGIVALITAILLIGVYFGSLFLTRDAEPISFSSVRILLAGLFALSAGGYILFDGMKIFTQDIPLELYTEGRQLSMMFSAYFLDLLVVEHFTGKKKSYFSVLMGISCVFDCILVLLSILKEVILYDTQFAWVLVQIVTRILLLAGILSEWKKAKIRDRVLLCGCGVLIVTEFLDFAGVGRSMFYPGICSKAAVLAFLLCYLLWQSVCAVHDHQAAQRSKLLEKQLEDSRIAMMMSQIHPHFLYNSLTAVMDLCDRDPKAAKKAIADFADYLRGNLASLKTQKPIPFEKELEHIEKYLRLEKLRFGERLQVEYDIQTEDFTVPALSVQPLVENAVKHGVGEKRGGGIVRIHTGETKKGYLIEVKDDGAGFEETDYLKDGKEHTGLSNIRERLEKMSGATLQIHSRKGEGTTAVILIPGRFQGKES